MINWIKSLNGATSLGQPLFFKQKGSIAGDLTFPRFLFSQTKDYVRKKQDCVTLYFNNCFIFMFKLLIMNQAQKEAIAAAEKALVAANKTGDQAAIQAAQAEVDRLKSEANR